MNGGGLGRDTQLDWLIQITDADLSATDRDHRAQVFYQDLYDLPGLEEEALSYIVDTMTPEQGRIGVQLLDLPPHRLRAVLEAVCDRIYDDPCEICLQIKVHAAQLQVISRNFEDLEAIIQAAEHLLPAPRAFQALVERYARRHGELTPVEQANLDWLRHQLDLTKETADSLVAKALGPHRTRQDKLDHYRQVFQAELNRHSPISPDLWKELQLLANNLGLHPDDTEPIHQNYLATIRAIDLQPEPIEPPSPEPAPTPEPAPDPIEQYRTLFEDTIRTSLFPREFDQGRLEQARRIWELSPEQTQAVEVEVTANWYGSVASAAGVDYSRLRQLLWSGEWQAADQETEQAMLQAAGSHDMAPLTGDTVLQIPCTDLLTINQLWLHHSHGRFGFSRQRQIYADEQRRLDAFLQRLEWQRGLSLAGIALTPSPLNYSELQFDLNAPPGHLPSWRWACEAIESGYHLTDNVVDAFFLHLEKCMPSDIPDDTLFNIPEAL
ncbi:putative GUN4 domain containing protein [Halomicronema hongdechloris C2206]|uniref:GUN4 domain containing protein n=1 Tax=Halomicronema hongdechloris C2206 TaxID=1641165 RepID=A0A1Z3HR11_9CYAN|nr:GUN4 domain-containing protein [Halomicronema hongdechloris]ASC72764.1 putative GUN4 domain containing protein [Halomicronema hongdechloris C2206]